MSVAYMSLYDYYKTNFILQQEHNWHINTLEDMFPFERDVYISLLAEHIQKKIEQRRSAG